MNRRNLLSSLLTVGCVGLAGCAAFEQEEQFSVVLENRGGFERDVSAEIRSVHDGGPGETTYFAREMNLDNRERVQFDEAVTVDGDPPDAVWVTVDVDAVYGSGETRVLDEAQSFPEETLRITVTGVDTAGIVIDS